MGHTNINSISELVFLVAKLKVPFNESNKVKANKNFILE